MGWGGRGRLLFALGIVQINLPNLEKSCFDLYFANISNSTQVPEMDQTPDTQLHNPELYKFRPGATLPPLSGEFAIQACVSLLSFLSRDPPRVLAMV